jgi:ketosteroid isomerase-like protein
MTSDPRYPSGEEVHAGDKVLLGGIPASIIFVTQRSEFADGISAADWSFVPGDAIAVRFEDGRIIMYDSFCDHDEIQLLDSSKAV